MQLVFVRHGYTEGNHKAVYSGWTDHNLHPEGIKILKKYKEDMDYPQTDRYYSSSLNRCLQTFDVLFGDKHQLDGVSDKFREINFGDYENKTLKEVPFPFFKDWFSNEVIANGETYSQVTNRLLTGIQNILIDLADHEQESATIVCHGGIIKMALILLADYPVSWFLSNFVENGQGYIFDIDYDKRHRTIDCLAYRPITNKKEA